MTDFAKVVEKRIRAIEESLRLIDDNDSSFDESRLRVSVDDLRKLVKAWREKYPRLSSEPQTRNEWWDLLDRNWALINKVFQKHLKTEESVFISRITGEWEYGAKMSEEIELLRAARHPHILEYLNAVQKMEYESEAKSIVGMLVASRKLLTVD